MLCGERALAVCLQTLRTHAWVSGDWGNAPIFVHRACSSVMCGEREINLSVAAIKTKLENPTAAGRRPMRFVFGAAAVNSAWFPFNESMGYKDLCSTLSLMC
jgi:hypothetical protein